MIFAAGAVLAVVLYFLFTMRQNKALYMETVGVIEATEVEISSKINGRIVWLCCKEGDRVKAGGIVVRLDSKEQAAGVDEARASLKKAQAEIQRLEVLVSEARKDLFRIESLYKEGVAAEKELDSAKTDHDALGSELNSAKARKDEAAAHLKLLAAALKDTEIESPIDATVVYKAFESGEMVSPGTAVYTLHDTENIWARVDIEESAMNRINLGGRAGISAPAFPGKEFQAEIIEIGMVGGFATQRDVTRGRPDIKTFRVKVGIKEHPELLRAGMTVKVRIF